MRDWWVGNDGAEYEKRAEVMIKQAETFEVHGVKLKGKLTQGENIADLGGLKLALRALNKHLNVSECHIISVTTDQIYNFLSTSNLHDQAVSPLLSFILFNHFSFSFVSFILLDFRPLFSLQQYFSQATVGTERTLINGFTPVQRFFLAWSQAWRENGQHLYPWFPVWYFTTFFFSHIIFLFSFLVSFPFFLIFNLIYPFVSILYFLLCYVM